MAVRDSNVFESGHFPNTAKLGRDPSLYPKKDMELLSTRGWTEVPKTEVDEVIEEVLAALKADGAFDDIIVDEDKIVANVIKALEDKGYGTVNEDVIKNNVVTALKEDTDFVNSLKGKDGNDAKAEDVAAALKADTDFVDSCKVNASEVATQLKEDSDFKDSLVQDTLDSIDELELQVVL